ncbi:meiosis-specific with OB domain-containing protein-like, partial [Argonauta hians]
DISTDKGPNKERYCLGFTLRDSVEWFMNATCWGEKSSIFPLSEYFRIGEVVEIKNAMAIAVTSFDEKFRPWTSSPLCLSINDPSSIAIYTGFDRDQYLYYGHLPTKMYRDYYTLEDININGQALHGEHVNLLVTVKKINEVKNIKTKTGKQLQQCEVKLFDETCSAFTLNLWDDQLIENAMTWIPGQTVLFINDVKTMFDEYKNYMTATATSKTVITINPEVEEAQHLYIYAENYREIEEFEDDGNDNPDPSSITDVYTVQEINDLLKAPSGKDVYGYCYSFISWFNVDSPNMNYLQYTCSECSFPINTESPICLNTNCESTFNEMKPPQIKFNLTMSFSDFTDSTKRYYISNDLVENLLNTSAAQYIQLSEERKTELKWKVLFERFKIYFKIQKQESSSQPNRMKVLHCFPVDLQEMSTYYRTKK